MLYQIHEYIYIYYPISSTYTMYRCKNWRQKLTSGLGYWDSPTTSVGIAPVVVFRGVEKTASTGFALADIASLPEKEKKTQQQGTSRFFSKIPYFEWWGWRSACTQWRQWTIDLNHQLASWDQEQVHQIIHHSPPRFRPRHEPGMIFPNSALRSMNCPLQWISSLGI